MAVIFVVRLSLTPDGFTLTMFVPMKVRWGDIDGPFEVSNLSYGYGSQRFVAFRYKPAAFGRGGRAGTQMVMTGFGMSPEAQAELMETWRQRWS